MLKIIDSKERINFYDAEDKLRNCNFILTDVVVNGRIITGRLYAVSEEPETLDALLDIENELRAQGDMTALGGEYETDTIGFSVRS